MLAFAGTEPPAWLLRRHRRRRRPPGSSVFRRVNVETSSQVRALTDAVQRGRPGRAAAAGGGRPGGRPAERPGRGDPLPGQHGARRGGRRDARRAGRARDRRASCARSGITVDYAPVCDLASDPRQPRPRRALVRDRPGRRRDARGGAHVRGLQAGGVAATAEALPGHGGTSGSTPTMQLGGDRPHDRAGLEAGELVPVPRGLRRGRADGDVRARRAARRSPAIRGLPATVSRRGHAATCSAATWASRASSITDALDMRALAQGPTQVVELIAARAGGRGPAAAARRTGPAQRRLEAGLALAALRGLVPSAHIRAATAPDPGAASLGGQLPDGATGDRPQRRPRGPGARAAARGRHARPRRRGLIPLRLGAGERVVVVTPQPRDLTPADTSVTEPLDLAAALARHHRGRAGGPAIVRAARPPTSPPSASRPRDARSWSSARSRRRPARPGALVERCSPRASRP